mgnify:CR=1 FL=1
MAKALQLTRVKGTLAAAERARSAAAPPASLSQVHGCEGTPIECAPSPVVSKPRPLRVAVDDESLAIAEPNKRAYARAAVLSSLPAAVRDCIHAIEMLRKLPDDMTTSLLSGSSLLRLLRHPSHHAGSI